MANFIKHESCDNCGSSDGKALYDDGSSHCFVCSHTIPSEEFKKSKTQNKGVRMKPQEKEVSTKDLKPLIDAETAQEIKNKTKIKGSNYRGIKDEVLVYFGVRTEYSDEGEVDAVYYPITYNSELAGYKIRRHPKTFLSVGRTGAECDLFGEFRYKQGGMTCLLVGGEHDQLAAYQMLREYQLSRGKDHYEVPVVVSPTVGETGCLKQIAAKYSFFDKFEKIIVAFDNDESGKKAMDKIIPALPKNKVFTMEMRHKDPNEYLDKNEADKFIRDYYQAKKYVPSGITGSDGLMEKVIEHAMMEKIPLPPFMKKTQDMLAGGIGLGHIVNIGAASGIGKTSIVNELIYFWLFNCPYKIGVVTMELSVGQYGEVMLSRHIQRKISLMQTVEEKLDFLNQTMIQSKAKELFTLENGDPRWLLIDDRDGDLESLQDKVEELVISCDCKVIVLDPLQDLLDGLSNEEQAVFMKWQKGMIRSHKVTFININHTRKSSDSSSAGSTGAFITEEDFSGSSTIFKSASVNILLMRDKYAEDPIVRNTTKAMMSKNRVCGITGPAGDYYYDNDTHTMYDKDYYFTEVAPHMLNDF